MHNGMFVDGDAATATATASHFWPHAGWPAFADGAAAPRSKAPPAHADALDLDLGGLYDWLDGGSAAGFADDDDDVVDSLPIVNPSPSATNTNPTAATAAAAAGILPSPGLVVAKRGCAHRARGAVHAHVHQHAHAHQHQHPRQRQQGAGGTRDARDARDEEMDEIDARRARLCRSLFFRTQSDDSAVTFDSDSDSDSDDDSDCGGEADADALLPDAALEPRLCGGAGEAPGSPFGDWFSDLESESCSW